MMEPLETTCQTAAAACAWTLLSSVGLSSAAGQRVSFGVCPEDALAIASIGSSVDARLRDEARDWFIEFDDLVSRPALKHRVKRLDESTWVEFAGPLGSTVRGTIPLVAGQHGDVFERTGKTRRAISPEPAYGFLRYRAAFGTQARADILFRLAAAVDPGRGWMADALALETGYVKSSVRQALDRLVEAGVVRRTRVRNADWFALESAETLESFVGQAVLGPVDTQVVAPMFQALVDASRMLDADDDPAVFVSARSKLAAVEREIADVRVQLPPPTHEFDRGRSELIETIRAAAEQLGDPSRPLWPW